MARTWSATAASFLAGSTARTVVGMPPSGVWSGYRADGCRVPGGVGGVNACDPTSCLLLDTRVVPPQCRSDRASDLGGGGARREPLEREAGAAHQHVLEVDDVFGPGDMPQLGGAERGKLGEQRIGFVCADSLDD